MSHTFYLDIDRCTGCYACQVACMDQNDSETSFRRVLKTEKKSEEHVKINYLSLSCMHCEDAPCVMACPTGAIKKQENGTVEVKQQICIGCHSCALACPFGVPRFNRYGKMEKCNLCHERVEYGLEPACVRICPAKALKIGEINELLEEIEAKAAKKITSVHNNTVPCVKNTR